MIQRVQSIYLFLAAAAVILFNYLSLGIDVDPDPDMLVFGKNIVPLFFGSIIIAAISLINIFLYSNRALQMRVCKINLALVLALIGATVYFLIGIPESAIEMPGMGLAMPLFTLIFSFLGLKKIGADEKIVRSMDRLR
ncbi:MAG: DUF4293 domain-containing protein [Bacteroidetes bacterium]|nr:DUF4293 domain-containing protein [Bacteroidota bacterium]